MTVSAQYAAMHLDDLLSVAESGEDVQIARPDKPRIRLVLDHLPERAAARGAGRAHLFGAGEGLITLPTDEEWRAMDKELEEQMVNGAIFPPERS